MNTGRIGGQSKKRPPPPARHQWVRQWMIAKGPALRQLVANTFDAITRFEAANSVRLRRRRPEDLESHANLVHVVVANLAHAVLAPPPTGRLAIRAGNAAKGAGRYDNP